MVADDSFLVRESLRQVPALSPRVEVVGHHASAALLLAAVDALPPDVVLTGIRMPPTQTDEDMQAAERLRLTHPRVGWWC